MKAVHRFEKADLGKGPFRLIGYSKQVGPIRLPSGMIVGCAGQPMGTCEYCGMGIVHVFRIESSDGKQFNVGSECVRHTGDEGLVRKAKKQMSIIQKQRKIELEQEKINQLKKWGEDSEVCAQLAKIPHPNSMRAARNETLADYMRWINTSVYAGNSSKLALYRKIKEILLDYEADEAAHIHGKIS